MTGRRAGNHEHRHSDIRYVSPAQRHAGENTALMQALNEVYARASANHPARWSGATRDWTTIEVATLNPERDSILEAFSKRMDKRLTAT